MSLVKLKKLSARKSSPSPAVAHLRRLKSKADQLPVIPAQTETELLQTPFREFCKTLRIKTDRGLKSFELFDWQGDFVDAVLENPRTPITLLSSRQTGKTADLLAMLIWLSLSREQFTALLIHRKGEDARALARRVKKLLPHGIKLTTDSLSLIEFQNGSALHFRGANHLREDGAETAMPRGMESCDMVVIEEASHTYNVREIVGVVGPTMTHSAMANFIFVGTSGRKETYFYESLCKAFGKKENLERTLEAIRKWEIKPFLVQKTDERIAVITNWRAIPKFANEGLDERGYPNYLKRIKKEQDLNQAQIDAEHELRFGSDETANVFEFLHVKAAETTESFEDAFEHRVYFAGVDGSGKPKPGRKGDYTVCLVLRKLDSQRLKVVRLYRKRDISFERRYSDISDILKDFDPLQVYVEANDGLGQTYEENLSAACPAQAIERWAQSAPKKAFIVNKIQLALERGDLLIPKCPVLDELLSFAQLENGAMGAVGKDAHDDCVMALGMALAAAQYGKTSEDIL